MPFLDNPATKDVIIIGAGASGLFCAVACARRGRSVLVLDHADRICSKVLVSGGGRCNFTNLNADAGHYLSANPHFCRSALARFSPQDMLALLKNHGIAWREKEAGQLFCNGSSRHIANMLAKECVDAGVAISLKTGIRQIKKESAFVLQTSRGEAMCESLVVATGGLSYPQLGATGFGYALARQFGIPVIDTEPALVPFTFSRQDRKLFAPLAGMSLNAAVRCGKNSFRGGILFTHRGLSGPAVLQASSFWRPGMPVEIDLLPETDIEAAFRSEARSRIEMKNFLARYLPKRFADIWCGLFAESKPLDQHSDRELQTVAGGLHGWILQPAGTEGYATAEVTRGGVDTRAISSKTMEAISVPGLYFIGEVVDVTGQLGGFNLHWAWASGHAAGQYA